jgi:phage terminase Nu1 subunit (DNA packaging protein)
MDDLKLIDVKLLANLLGKSVRTIHRWRRNGKLPAPIIEDRFKPYWSRTQLTNWVKDKARQCRTNTDSESETD